MAASERMRVLCEDCSGYNTTPSVKDGKTVAYCTDCGHIWGPDIGHSHATIIGGATHESD